MSLLPKNWFNDLVKSVSDSASKAIEKAANGKENPEDKEKEETKVVVVEKEVISTPVIICTLVGVAIIAGVVVHLFKNKKK